MAKAQAAAPDLLSIGKTGPTVRIWQRFIGVTVDGQYGAETAQATKEWQLAHGLTPDGIVGLHTYAQVGLSYLWSIGEESL